MAGCAFSAVLCAAVTSTYFINQSVAHNHSLCYMSKSSRQKNRRVLEATLTLLPLFLTLSITCRQGKRDTQEQRTQIHAVSKQLLW